MCKRLMQINASCVAGIRRAYVPCGKCVDCRRVQAQSWSFRINSEFLDLKKRGWNVAFCTLTYRPENLHYIPIECFVDLSEYKEIPCFSRADAREWIDNVRQYCKYHFKFRGANRMRYFIATELGTRTHRPHLHAVLAWPNSVGYEEMHTICTHFWKHGFLFPRHPEGDRLTGCLSFEIVGDASKCLTYVSKYVCKDLELESLQSGIRFYNKRKDYENDSEKLALYRTWRNCQGFHIQSQSLGFEALKNLSDDEKMDIYRHGMYFSSDKNARPQQLPIYLKHKLIFDPYYTYVYDPDKREYKRMVQRRANAFFLAHAREIFDMKAEFYSKYCAQSEGAQYYIDRGMDENLSNRIAGLIQRAKKRLDSYNRDFVSDNQMGRYYLAYNAVSNAYSYDIDLCNQWLLRYYPDAKLSSRFAGSDSDFDCMLYDLKYYWSLIDKANSFLGHIGAPERENDEKILLEILDFFNNEVNNYVI